jgi:hypothetical protein
LRKCKKLGLNHIAVLTSDENSNSKFDCNEILTCGTWR